METKIKREKETVSSSVDEYRASVKNLIDREIGDLLDEDIRSASRELLEEQRRAIREVIAEHKLVIRQVVEEEKQAIHERIEELRRSITKLGLR